jgi:hypothetical protein
MGETTCGFDPSTNEGLLDELKAFVVLIFLLSISTLG